MTRYLIVLTLVLFAVPALAAPAPVWLHGAPAPGANSATVTVTDAAGHQQTYGLWAFPFTGEEALPVGFAPASPRPGGWAAIAWLEEGRYQLATTSFTADGIAHISAPEPLTVPAATPR